MLTPYAHNRTITTTAANAPYRPLPPASHVPRGSRNAGPYGSQQWKFFSRPLVASGAGDKQRGGLESVRMRHEDDEPQQYQSAEATVQLDFGNNGAGHNERQPMQQQRGAHQQQRLVQQHQHQQHIQDQSESLTRDAATQSLFRDSSAQTDPFTPDVFVPDGQNPEVLALAALKFPNGFEMTEETMKEIDRIRRRRDVEGNLPMGVNAEAFEERVRLLKKLEMQEWHEREEKIQNEQEERLGQIRHRLERREKQREERNKARIQKKRDMHMETLSRELEKIETKRQKTMRKTQKKHANPENTLHRRDIIEEQTFYAPPHKREGRIAHDKTIAYEIQPALLTDPLGVHEVEMHQARKLMRLRPLPERTSVGTSTLGGDVTMGSTKRRTANDRKKQKVIDNIEFARKLQLVEKMKKEEDHSNLLDMYRATPRVSRPKTPVLEFDDEEDDLENAVITIQKLMRGREKQNDFFIGKERTYELIKELQEVEKVVRREQDLKGKHPELVREAEEKEEQQLVTNVMENVQAEVLAKALDYLSKELVRQREMDRIMVIKTMAEMERRKREARELGRRQKEEEQRTQQEQIFTEIARTTDDTIDTYLDQIFDETADRLAHRQALQEVYNQTKDEADQREAQRELERSAAGGVDATPQTDDNEIKDLVTSFLIPQVKRSTVQHQVEMEQKKYLKSVHETFLDVLREVADNVDQEDDEDALEEQEQD
mmetsp:Transcript_9785/g.36514  ORF Transcript_9785/g.36514 Transcript_9785/m.36514 type:complete len:716 (-) Transcript_9785:95-2242(-)|eukprot:CAMPEP_0117445488 /NCGR_PEP_ID=MMETSP0759-20121206/5823_1 /TAXON_ID=63605 /ORGANISM="Percolomonas cosmopolitus, Strain WS" /LENGTH=715 /DNA_ID=CAMNT_0005237669 /DNA_START=313 /DNA_END=2460 /DNA_ORIENTATION=+